jgi:hypothetical protein
MANLALILIIFAFLFYVQEVVSEKPSVLCAAIYLAAVIEGALMFAL